MKLVTGILWAMISEFVTMFFLFGVIVACFLTQAILWPWGILVTALGVYVVVVSVMTYFPKSRLAGGLRYSETHSPYVTATTFTFIVIISDGALWLTFWLAGWLYQHSL